MSKNVFNGAINVHYLDVVEACRRYDNAKDIADEILDSLEKKAINNIPFTWFDKLLYKSKKEKYLKKFSSFWYSHIMIAITQGLVTPTREEKIIINKIYYHYDVEDFKDEYISLHKLSRLAADNIFVTPNQALFISKFKDYEIENV